MSWSPVPFMNAEEMAHFLPRLVEFAVFNPNDRDGAPYAIRFINSVSEGPNDDQFKLPNKEQREMVFRSLQYIYKKNILILLSRIVGKKI